MIEFRARWKPQLPTDHKQLQKCQILKYIHKNQMSRVHMDNLRSATKHPNYSHMTMGICAAIRILIPGHKWLLGSLLLLQIVTMRQVISRGLFILVTSKKKLLQSYSVCKLPRNV